MVVSCFFVSRRRETRIGKRHVQKNCFDNTNETQTLSIYNEQKLTFKETLIRENVKH